MGESDLRVSRIGLGCNNFGRRVDLAGTRAVVDAALDAGVTFLDCAESYGDGESERFLGEVLQGRRDRVVLATKFGMRVERGGSRAYLTDAADRSLERLRTDRIDLYYYHRPDGETPIAETLAALDELVRAGKVRYLGASNFSAAQLREADEVARAEGLTPFVAVQNEYSLLERGPEAEVLPACRELGIGFVPYFPLASGLLTGKYRRGAPAPEGTRLAGSDRLTDEAFDRVEALERFAAERGRSLLELALAALASEPGVAGVIAGATKPEQVRANAAAADWQLAAAERDELRRVA
ncbi:MAG TPA: aldo/keto reductase [Gaiellaceae bacterium]|nr:aldo/keto reductase [Gaiellaceae bacterium]